MLSWWEHKHNLCGTITFQASFQKQPGNRKVERTVFKSFNFLPLYQSGTDPPVGSVGPATAENQDMRSLSSPSDPHALIVHWRKKRTADNSNSHQRNTIIYLYGGQLTATLNVYLQLFVLIHSDSPGIVVVDPEQQVATVVWSWTRGSEFSEPSREGPMVKSSVNIHDVHVRRVTFLQKPPYPQQILLHTLPQTAHLHQMLVWLKQRA